MNDTITPREALAATLDLTTMAAKRLAPGDKVLPNDPSFGHLTDEVKTVATVIFVNHNRVDITFIEGGSMTASFNNTIDLVVGNR